MIDFPAGVTITIEGAASCGVFLAYHAAVLIDGAAVPYGVHPDCGKSFGGATTAHSHELVEAITDPATSLALGLARPMAWRMAAILTGADEISDICEAPGTGVGIVEGYKVTKNWSNFANACVVSIPVCDGTMTPPECRPCSPFDAGFACSGDTPLCAGDGPKAGLCIGCTADNTSACTAETPLCDLATNTCVSCLESSDCKGPAASVCDDATGACRGCSATEECSSGLCDTDADAQAGQCVEYFAPRLLRSHPHLGGERRPRERSRKRPAKNSAERQGLEDSGRDRAS